MTDTATTSVGGGYTVVTGGALGADTLAMRLAEEWGMKISLHLPPHSPLVSEKFPAIAAKPLASVTPQVIRACERLGRHPTKNPFVRDLLARNWFIMKEAKVLFAYAKFEDDSLTSVEGGSGITVQLCVDHNRDDPLSWKDVFVFDESLGKWYRLERDESRDSDESSSEYEGAFSETLGTFSFRECICSPILHQTSGVVGSRHLGELGRKTMKEQFRRTVKQRERWAESQANVRKELDDTMEELQEMMDRMSLKKIKTCGAARPPIKGEDCKQDL